MIIIYAEIYLTNIKSLQKQNPGKRKSLESLEVTLPLSSVKLRTRYLFSS